MMLAGGPVVLRPRPGSWLLFARACAGTTAHVGGADLIASALSTCL